MSELVLDKTVHDDGSNNAKEDSSNSQAGVDDHCLFIHPLPLLAIGERGKAGTDERVEKQLRRETERCHDELPKCDCVDRLRNSDQQTETDEIAKRGPTAKRVLAYTQGGMGDNRIRTTNGRPFDF